MTLLHSSVCCLELDTEEWSDDDSQMMLDAMNNRASGGGVNLPSNNQEEVLEARLQGAQLKIVQLQSLVHELVGAKEDIETGPLAETSARGQPKRDDDTHYFESYGYLGPTNSSSQLDIWLI